MNAAIRNEFTIKGMGTLCRQIQSRCIECQKLKQQSTLMAPHLDHRLGQKLKPFDINGLDFAGPFEIKMGRGKIHTKVYVLNVNCMVNRGVHLETTGSMNTSHVIDAISRFFDVRGVPATLTLGNQTLFQTSYKEITKWYKSVDWNAVQAATGLRFWPSSDGIKWHLKPPNASHFGCIFKIIFIALKRAMKIVIGWADHEEEADLLLESHVHAEQSTNPAVWKHSRSRTVDAKSLCSWRLGQRRLPARFSQSHKLRLN
jgi:hypothetical protein